MEKYSRRSFIKAFILTLGATSLGNIVSSCEKSTEGLTPSPLPVEENIGSRSYYVDRNLGGDDNLGTEIHAPWKTLTKLNSSVLSPGDKIFLKSGSIWISETLLLTSGVSYESYGEGPQPIIDGNNDVNCIVGLGIDSVNIRNIQLSNGLDSCAVLNNCSNVNIYYCVMHGAGNDNLAFINGCRDAKVIGGEYFNPYQRQQGSLVSCIEIADGGRGFLIDGARLHGSPSAGLTIHNHSLTDPQGRTDIPTGIVIKDVSSYNNGLAGINIMAQDTSAAVKIEIINSELRANRTGIRIHKTFPSAGYPNGEIIVNQCKILDNDSFGVYLQGDGIEISRSLLAGVNQQNFIIDSKDINLFNNTFYTAPSDPIWALFITGIRTHNIILRNSIVYVGTQSGQIVGTDEGVTENLMIDHNAYYFPDYSSQRRWMWDRVAYNFDEWRWTTGQDENSFLIREEIFEDLDNGDFTILENSSVIDKGIDIGQEFEGASPDIGYTESK